MAPTSEQGILLLGVQDDVEEGPDDWVFGKEGQKFGGRPTFLQREAVEDEWKKLEQDGFRLLVQFGWPECVEGAVTKGDWPFGGGAFSIAFRGEGSSREWRWCWQVG